MPTANDKSRFERIAELARPLLLEFRLAFRNVVRQRRRSAIAIIAVGFGVVALLLAGGFIEWIYREMREATIHSQLGHVRIYRPGFLDSGLADPYAYLLPANAPELAAAESLAHVVTVGPRLNFVGLVSRQESTLSFIGEGVDPDKEREISRSLIITQGENLSAQDPQGIIMGEGLAANLGVNVGETVVILVNTENGGMNGADVRVRGLFTTVSKLYDDSAMRVPIVVARKLLRVTGAHVWIVLLDNTRYTDAVTKILRTQLPDKSYEVVPWYKLADFYNKTVELFSKQVGFVKLIIGVIIVLSISNTMMMTIMERTGEIGTTLALGVRRIKVLYLFLAEGIILGLLGGGGGMALGYLLARIISAVGIPMPAPPGMAHGFLGEIVITPGLASDAILLAIGTTLLASVYPAWKASRMQIVDALRHNR